MRFCTFFLLFLGTAPVVWADPPPPVPADVVVIGATACRDTFVRRTLGWCEVYYQPDTGGRWRAFWPDWSDRQHGQAQVVVLVKPRKMTTFPSRVPYRGM